MTSTARGDGGPSFGWINDALLASTRRDAHFNAFGGEDRFWLGPEGGPFALFFSKGSPFDLEHWHTPAPLDTEPYPVVLRDPLHVVFERPISVTNYEGVRFELTLRREVRLVAPAEVWEGLGTGAPEAVDLVAFESVNRITNTGSLAWRKETGLLSIWILGMLEPFPDTTVVVPIERGSEEALGPLVNDAYFGRVPADRLVAREGVLFFRGDGRHRSKIGVSPRRAKPVLGSLDAARGVLTLVQFDKPEHAVDYVNSMWDRRERPYEGDVVNSYNDGPPAPGAKALGPFYELETSSPAAALTPGESLVHRHRTVHLIGDRAGLDSIARKALGVGFSEIESALEAAGP
jgi:hypothetical protein